MLIKRVSAYAAIYLLWGGAYLPVRVLVHILPSFLIAGVRYGLAALLMLPIILIHGGPVPTRRQMLHALWTGVAMLTVGFGVVFWAESRLPSWIVAVLMSTTFLWTYLGECFVLRSVRLQGRMLLPLLVGLAGMPWLVGGSLHGSRVSIVAVLVVLCGAICWSAGSLAVKRIDLPRAYVRTAGLQLAFSGLLLLCFSGLLGEWRRLPAPALIFTWKPLLALFYLVVPSSLVAFVAFHWLLRQESASQVATSAYVNPMVAMLLGIVVAQERSSPLQLMGACAVLVSIVSIWLMRFNDEKLMIANLQQATDS